MDVCSPTLLDSLNLHSPAAEDPASSEFSDASDLTFEEEHTQKARRYSGQFRSCAQTPRPAGLEPADQAWTAADSSALYGVPGWGADYVEVSKDGTLMVKPAAENGPAVDLFQLTQALQAQGLRAPMLFRFMPIIGHRIDKLNAAFKSAIDRFEYQGLYRGVFPVKANHDRALIESIVDYGEPYGFGLEVGSKAELVMVMSQLAGRPAGTNLVCNGFKDAEYMELVLHCRELGMNAMVVMEQFSELDLLLDVAGRMGVRPSIGIRAKLTTRHNGHWGSTSGDKAKFGLRAREIVAVVNRLGEEGMLDCLNLLHFHVGSQITNIRMVKEVMREASFLYAELVKMGAGMAFIDCGGGLAVDYDGSFTDSHASMSYTLQHYANDIVSAMQEVCIQRGIPPPTIITESGRALASHHSVLVFDVLTTPECLHEKRVEQEEVVESIEIRDDRPLTKQLRAAARSGKGTFLLMTFKEVFENITPDASALREAFNDASYFKDEAVRAFKLGVLSLEERAQVDMMFDAACERIRQVAREHDLPLPDALRPDAAMPHTKMYHVNLSVFRSAVDSWAIQQLFPIVPIHRLGEEPSVPATLADLTCDSDGKVDRFINPKGGDPLPALPLHPLRLGEKYYLALFLTGVYQEVMGSLHNMFGSLNTVVISHKRRQPAGGAADAGGADADVAAQGGAPMSDGATSSSTSPSSCSLCSLGTSMEADSSSPSVAHAAAEAGAAPAAGAAARIPLDGVAGLGEYSIEAIVPGETIGEVLSRANHSADDMLSRVGAATAAAVGRGDMSAEVADRLLATYSHRMAGYTYMQA